MNVCVFCGRTTADMQLRYTTDQKAFGSVNLAVETGYGDRKKTSFFKITAFGKTAESFTKYIQKGRKVIVECKAQQEEWTDRNGNKRSTVGFIMDSWEFADGKPEAKKDDGNDLLADLGEFTTEELQGLPFD